MKYLKLFEAFESGPRIDLTDDEVNFLNGIIDEYIQELASIRPGDLKKLGYEKIDYSYWKQISDTYTYKSADGQDCSVTFWIGYAEKASGFMSSQDNDNLNDQRVCMCWNAFYPMFGSFTSKVFKSLYNIDAKEIFRKTLYHEFIHAKDPHVNHSTPIDIKYSLDPHVYFASSAEFYSMTGQLLEAIENRVNTLLDRDLDEEQYKVLKGSLEGLYKYFSADIDAVDRNDAIKRHMKDVYKFIKDDERNTLQNILLKVTNWGISFLNLFSKKINLDSFAGYDVKVLDTFLYYITQIKSYNREGYEKFVLELRKCVESCAKKVNDWIGDRNYEKVTISGMGISDEYYTLKDGKQEGPMSWEELKQVFFKQARANQGWYDKNLNVWKKGMKNWTSAWKLPELAPIFKSLRKGE